MKVILYWVCDCNKVCEILRRRSLIRTSRASSQFNKHITWLCKRCNVDERTHDEPTTSQMAGSLCSLRIQYRIMENRDESQDYKLCMTPKARIPHCAWLTRPGYLTVHDSLSQDASLCMTPKARVPHCACTRGAMHSQVAWQKVTDLRLK